MGSVFRPRRRRKDGTIRAAKRWYIQYRDATGKQIRRVGGVTKDQAKMSLAEAEKRVIAIRNGLPAPNGDEVLCESLLAEFLTAKKGKTEDEQIDLLRKRIRRILVVIRALRLSDLNPRIVKLAILEFGKTLKSRTLKRYGDAITAMTKWGVQEGLLSEDPLACLAMDSGGHDETRKFVSNFPITWGFISARYHVSESVGPFQIYIPR